MSNKSSMTATVARFCPSINAEDQERDIAASRCTDGIHPWPGDARPNQLEQVMLSDDSDLD
jgi:hypothetical protein